MTPVYLCALLAQLHARRHGHHVTRIVVSPQVSRKEKSVAMGAFLAALVIAALASCRGAVAPRTEIPPSPSSAAPVVFVNRSPFTCYVEWCEECAGLPNLGMEPKVRRASR